MLEQEDPWADRPPAVPHEYRGKAGFLKWVPAKKDRDGEYKRSSKRVATPNRPKSRTLFGRCFDEITPWRLWEYPGRARMMSGVMGCTIETSHQWLSGGRVPGVAATLRLAAFLRAKAERFMALADELEASAASRGRQGVNRFAGTSVSAGQVRAGSGLLPPAE